MKTKANRRDGLSLVELAVVLATVALVAIFVFPMLLRPRARVHPISCSRNLKQIGIAYRLYSADHSDRYPFAVSNELGGSLNFVTSPQVFKHYEVMSNEIVSPKLLVCPSDTQKVRGTDFLRPLNNINVSYFVGLDADETKPQSLLSGDRNITGGKLNNGFLRVLQTNSWAGWTAQIHVNSGNVGLGDGSVQQMTPQSLQNQLRLQSFNNIRLAIP